LSETNNEHFFTLHFSDKAEWNNFKEDLKSIFRNQEIKYQYSEKAPNFHILYKNNQVMIRIDWKDDQLHFNLKTLAKLNKENLQACNEIYDLLLLFEGELKAGSSPYEW
jgi:hypothetical protein